MREGRFFLFYFILRKFRKIIRFCCLCAVWVNVENVLCETVHSYLSSFLFDNFPPRIIIIITVRPFRECLRQLKLLWNLYTYALVYTHFLLFSNWICECSIISFIFHVKILCEHSHIHKSPTHCRLVIVSCMYTVAGIQSN